MLIMTEIPEVLQFMFDKNVSSDEVQDFNIIKHALAVLKKKNAEEHFTVGRQYIVKLLILSRY